jgi:SpoVK/Ycf46/Vps4 family AAA+-type ATPase
VLRSHGLEPRHKILLIGPPGNGKTSLAEALAYELGVTFFVVRYETVIGSFLGETSGRLKQIFDYVRTVPCVLFFDEFDTLGKERGDTHETGEIKRVVSTLLLQIDDLPSYTVVVTATNHQELLDSAVWRRFQIKIELPLPDSKSLFQYFKSFFSRYNEPTGISVSEMSKQLLGTNFAEAEEFCLDIQRRFVLSLGQKRLHDIIALRLGIWKKRIMGKGN